jgi:hypothetical protein
MLTSFPKRAFFLNKSPQIGCIEYQILETESIVKYQGVASELD